MSDRMQRRVVCAAIRNSFGKVICGPRHFDAIMHRQIEGLNAGDWKQAEQGFVDQRGEFLTRKEAYDVAWAANQVIRRVGGDNDCLYSENLY